MYFRVTGRNHDRKNWQTSMLDPWAARLANAFVASKSADIIVSLNILIIILVRTFWNERGGDAADYSVRGVARRGRACRTAPSRRRLPPARTGTFAPWSKLSRLPRSVDNPLPVFMFLVCVWLHLHAATGNYKVDKTERIPSRAIFLSICC